LSWLKKGLTLEIDYEDYRDYFIYLAKKGFNNCGESISEDDLVDLINKTNLMKFSLILDGQTITIKEEKSISERANFFISQEDNLEQSLKYVILESTKNKVNYLIAVPYGKLNEALYSIKNRCDCRFEYLSDTSAVIWDTSSFDSSSYYDFDEDFDKSYSSYNKIAWKLEIHEHLVMNGHETIIIRPEKWI
jgi:hypothetical protein